MSRQLITRLHPKAKAQPGEYVSRVLAEGFALLYWLWSSAITLVGGVGAGLSCEGGDGCRKGFPSWLEPWGWEDYYVYPEALYVSFAGLAASSALVAFVVSGRRWYATTALLLSVVFSSYPYFAAGADVSGRTVWFFSALGWLGLFLGVMALATMRTRATSHELQA